VQSGSNALHCAALNGHAGVIRVLVPVKCNVNQQRKDGWTLLQVACCNGHQDVVHELIVCKSKVNMRTTVGKKTLFLGCKCCKYFYAWVNFFCLERTQVKMSISFHMCIQEGMGALHLAAAKGHDEIVQELLDAGVAPDMQDKVMELHNLCKSLGHLHIIVV